jgi:dihydroflavonol-4-reductase
MKRTAFVTGATGFVGLNLVRELVEQGWEVTALHRPTSDLKYLRRFDVTLRVGTLEDEEALERAIPPAVDAVFHVAASLSFWGRRRAEQQRTNVEGTRNVVRVALAQRAKRFVHTSSVAAFWSPGSHITEETASTAATAKSGYIRTKYLAEQEVRTGIAAGLDAVILNPVNIIGPYDVHGWGRALRMVAQGRLPGIPPGSASFCHSAEVARAQVASVERGRAGHNYLLAGVDASFLELFQCIGRLLGRSVPSRPLPAFLIKTVGTVMDLGGYVTGREPEITRELAAAMCEKFTCSSDKAERELGYRPRTMEEMVRDCRDWLVREGYLVLASA